MRRGTGRGRVLPLLVLGLISAAASATAGAAEASFDSWVDAYLDGFAAFHPSIAAGNGLHGHDGELEDFSAARIAAELRWFDSERAALAGFDERRLSADERIDRRILLGIIDGWLLDLRVVRTWKRNPMMYVAAVADGMHDLVTMESAPEAERMSRAITKLAGVPRLFAAARANIRNPPRVFAEHALVMLAGTRDLLRHDLPLAFPAGRDARLRARLLAAATLAERALAGYGHELSTQVLPHASGSFAIGLAQVEARYRAEEMIDLPGARLLEIGRRELERTQAEFAAAAARIDSARDPQAVWASVQAVHPAAGELVPAAQALVAELTAFVAEHGLARIPDQAQVRVAPAPAYDLGLASMHTSPPLEPQPVASYYYITDVRPEWPLARQQAWLRMFNTATLADITAHEVMPGHYLHGLYMRRTPGKVRRIWVGLNPFPQPSSGQDGWAHYAEQLVSDAGFHAAEPGFRMAMLAEAQTRIVRLMAGIRLHEGSWTLAEASACFERAAHLPPPAARREAERGTYDPTYGGYFLGKLAALELRRDVEAARGAAFDLREFHERLMSDGIAPWWAHRQLLLPGDARAVID